MALIDLTHIQLTINEFLGKEFTTLEFVDKFKEKFPEDWKFLVDKYGKGGKGAGRNYSANSYVAKILSNCSKRKEIDLIDEWPDSPKGWGSPIIAKWQAPSNEAAA